MWLQTDMSACCPLGPPGPFLQSCSPVRSIPVCAAHLNYMFCRCKGLKGEMWVVKADYERKQIFLCQWLHDRECHINFFFLWESQLFFLHLLLPLFSFCTPKTSSGMSMCMSAHWSYPQAQKVIIQVFPIPSSSYSYTDLQHIVSLDCLVSR